MNKTNNSIIAVVAINVKRNFTWRIIKAQAKHDDRVYAQTHTPYQVPQK